MGLQGPAGPEGPPVFAGFYSAEQNAATSQAGNVWSDVPGVSINISLADPRTLQMEAFGSFNGSGGSANYSHCGIRFVVDGVPYGNPSWGDQLLGIARPGTGTAGWHHPWNIKRWLPVGAGNHVVKLQIAGWDSSDLGCYLDTGDYSRARLYIMAR